MAEFGPVGQDQQCVGVGLRRRRHRSSSSCKVVGLAGSSRPQLRVHGLRGRRRVWSSPRPSSIFDHVDGGADSRMSSVSPLNARPSTARRLPRSVHRAERTLAQESASVWVALMRSDLGQQGEVDAESDRLPSGTRPHPLESRSRRSRYPGRKNLRLQCGGPAPCRAPPAVRLRPPPRTRLATALMKEILRARKALEACLMISAALRGGQRARAEAVPSARQRTSE